MNRTSKLARLICLLIVLGAFFCFVAGIDWRQAQAQATNGRIAFTSDSTIYTINPDGSGITQLTPSGSGTFDRLPAWSPDGTKIAFGRTTFQISAPEIYVMNADGSNQTRITNNSRAAGACGLRR